MEAWEPDKSTNLIMEVNFLNPKSLINSPNEEFKKEEEKADVFSSESIIFLFDSKYGFNTTYNL